MPTDPARTATALSPLVAVPAPERRAQQVAAIAAALVVTAGVVWFDWPAFIVLALYWIENVVIGIANVIRLLAVGLSPLTPGGAMAAAVPSAKAGSADPAEVRKALFATRAAGVVGTVFLVPFFCFHYGMFCLVHGVFVVTLFSGDPAAKNVFFDAPFYMLGRVLSEGWGWVALLAIVASVVVDTARWFARRRYDDLLNTAKTVMHEPYGRIVVLHVVLLAGGFLMQITKAPQAAVLLLTVFKLIYDLRRLRKLA